MDRLILDVPEPYTADESDADSENQAAIDI